MTWRPEDSSHNMNITHSNGSRGYTQQDSSHESNQSSYQLLAFKKSIKREVSQYSILKDDNRILSKSKILLVLYLCE